MPVLFGRSFTRGELERHVGDTSQLFGIDLVEHADGPERGVRLLRFRTGGGLSFDVLLDRAMDVAGLDWRGVPIGWHSPTGFRSPWLHEHDGEDGLGFLRSFSGIMNTCGLDHIMGPEEESADHYAYPYRKQVRHGLHGRVAYTPARLLAYGLHWDGDRCLLRAEGEIRQAAMFGEFLVMHRRIEAEVGGDTVTIEDTVTNRGFQPTPHAILYHVNLGYPVVGERTRLVAPIVGTPFTAHDPSVTSIGPLEQAPPQPGFVEQVYEHDLAAESDGTTFAALVDAGFAWPGGGQGLGFCLGWDQSTLPALYQWQNLREGNYVIGIEPGSAHAGSRDDRKRRGEIVFLEHGEQRRYRLTLQPLAGESALAALEGRIARIVGAPLAANQA